MEALHADFGGDDFSIVHDNPRFATCPYIRKYLRDRRLTKYSTKIPSYSPNMNLIENVWSMLERAVGEHQLESGQVRNRAEFGELIVSEWRLINIRYIRSLYESLPRRMNMVKEDQG